MKKYPNYEEAREQLEFVLSQLTDYTCNEEEGSSTSNILYNVEEENSVGNNENEGTTVEATTTLDDDIAEKVDIVYVNDKDDDMHNFEDKYLLKFLNMNVDKSTTQYSNQDIIIQVRFS